MNRFARELTAVAWAMHPRHLGDLISRVDVLTDEQIESKVRAITERGDLLERVRTGNDPMNLKRRAADVSEADLDVRDGVAHIPISGPMMKQVPSIFNWIGIKATSTEAVREELAVAVESGMVDSIVLDIDSPGGTVDGTSALAADVRAAASLKPVTAVAPDLMASAAMWVGAQASKVHVGEAATVGSIGVYSVVDDTHRKHEKAGIHTHVVSSHELKGAFVDGSQVTQAQLDDLEREMNEINDVFVSAVASGRRMSADSVRELATGQTWIGQGAVDRGLADKVVAASDLPRREAQPEITFAVHSVSAPTSEQIASEFKNRFATIAAPAASKETPMTEQERKELEALREKNAALETKNAQLAADAKEADLRAKAADVAARRKLLSDYADRIEPAMQADIEEFVLDEKRSPEKVEAFLKSLDRVVRDRRESVVPQMDGTGITPDMIKRLGHRAMVGEPKVAAFLGLNERRMNAIDNLVDGAMSDGTFMLKDGSKVTTDQLKAMLQ